MLESACAVLGLRRRHLPDVNRTVAKFAQPVLPNLIGFHFPIFDQGGEIVSEDGVGIDGVAELFPLGGDLGLGSGEPVSGFRIT